MIDAEAAARIGLATEVVPADKLMDRARELAGLIAANGPYGVGLSKRAINVGGELDMHRGLQMEADLFGMVFSTEDRVEGVSAFLDKRPAQFKGR
jgi:enoyl-CoA hydratase